MGNPTKRSSRFECERFSEFHRPPAVNNDHSLKGSPKYRGFCNATTSTPRKNFDGPFQRKKLMALLSGKIHGGRKKFPFPPPPPPAVINDHSLKGSPKYRGFCDATLQARREKTLTALFKEKKINGPSLGKNSRRQGINFPFDFCSAPPPRSLYNGRHT